MNWNKNLISVLLCLLFTGGLRAQHETRVMSFNIRLDVASDGENRWDARKEKVAGLVRYHGADLIGGQEVQHHQLRYLLSALPGFKSIGVGRDDGKSGGEYSCIFYNAEKFEALENATFWLSPTPATPSKGWDAAYPRVCTYGLFQRKGSGEKFWMFNTHLDHIGTTARLEAARLISERVAIVNEKRNYPVIITGDFNAQPLDSPVVHMNGLFDNARMVAEQPAYGPADTWNAFQFLEQPKGCIDYVFISKGKWKVKKFATLTDSYEMKYPSDHFPVMASLEMLTTKKR